MPTYEFRCPDGSIVERVFKISEVPETIPSPHGDGDAVRVISGGAGLIFKGSGFYITDYGKDGKKDQRSSSAEPKAGGEGSGSTAAAPSSPSAGASAGGSAASGSGSGGASSGGSASGGSASGGSASGGSASGSTPAAS
jgi:predicted nucleic acid-binding Zn ribbon protein